MSGIATHYITSDRIPELMNRLSEVESTSIDVVNHILEVMSGNYTQYIYLFTKDPIQRSEWDSWSLGGQNTKIINTCFKFNTLEEIISALNKSNTKFAKETLKYLYLGSPTSCKVTLSQLRKGAKLHFRDCFKMEYNLSRQFMVNL